MAFAPGVQAGQRSEAVLGCEILNRLTDLSRSVSYRIGPVRILSVGIVQQHPAPTSEFLDDMR